jgi:DNA repair protein SbcC/Rad50
LRYLELKNYRKFRSVRVEFPDGVVGIVGQNGSGKSSLVEAIAWALYGNESSIVRTTKEGIRSSSAGPNDECMVELEFDLGPDHYRVLRSIKGKNCISDATLTVNGALSAQTDRGVTQLIVDRLGMDYKSFFISVFARQKELNALSTLRPADRKKTILRMLEIDVLDDIVVDIDRDAKGKRTELSNLNLMLFEANGQKKREKIEAELSSLSGEVLQLESSLQVQLRLLEALDKRTNLVKMEWDQAEAKFREYSAHQQRAAEIRAGIGRNIQAIERLTKDIIILKDKGKKAGELENANRQYVESMVFKDSMESSRSRFIELEHQRSRRSRSEMETVGLQEKITKAKMDLAELREPTKHLASVEDNLKRAEENVADLNRKADWLRGEEQRVEKEIRSREKKKADIQTIGPNSKCPTCERTLAEHYTKLLELMESEITEMRSELTGISSQHKATAEDLQKSQKVRSNIGSRLQKLRKDVIDETRLTSSIKGLEDQIEKSRSDMAEAESTIIKIGDVDFDAATYERLKRQLIDLKGQSDQYNQLTIEAMRLPDVESQKAALEGQVSSEQEELGMINEKMALSGHSEESLDKARRSYLEVRDRKEAKAKETYSLQNDIDRKRAEMARREDQLSQLAEVESKVGMVQKESETLAVLGEVMREFRSNVISRIVPTLSQICSGLFEELTDAKYNGMELDENYDISIYDKGQKYPLDRFSGGEVDLANLCLRLAISRIIAERSGSSINFLVLDEIFGSQDMIRKRNIMETFTGLSKQFGQIILITHLEDIKDLMGNVINVKELPNGSSEVSVIN